MPLRASHCSMAAVVRKGTSHNRGSGVEGGRKGEIPLWTPESHGCPFAGRCHQAMARCKESLPPVTRLADNHFVRCYLHE